MKDYIVVRNYDGSSIYFINTKHIVGIYKENELTVIDTVSSKFCTIENAAEVTNKIMSATSPALKVKRILE